jgi:aspartyl-tRNA(Asn)/glutamyl-tRNA(Gln) amidotransferase subunit C
MIGAPPHVVAPAQQRALRQAQPKRALSRCARSRFQGTSMQVDEATVQRIARLARIKVTPEEAKSLEKELSGILNWVEQLGEVDTANVEPMTRVVPIALPKRKDEVTDGEIPDQVTKNAPQTEDHFFVVPKVVE